MNKQDFLEKVKKHEAVIDIVGLGYADLPLLPEFYRVGFPVLGVNIGINKLKILNSTGTFDKTSECGTALVSTDHGHIGYELIRKNAPLIIDSSNVVKPLLM